MNAKVYTISAWIGLGLACVFFLGYTAAYLPQKYTKQGFGKTDLAVFYVAGASFLDKVSVEPDGLYLKNQIKPAIKSIRKRHGGSQFLYPPAAALFFVPFALTSFKWSATLWVWLNAGLFLLAYYLTIIFLIPDKSFFKFRYSLILIALAFSSPVFSLLKSGQINGVLWVLFILSFILLQKRQRVLPGVALAVPIIIKMFSVFFLAPLLFRKKFWTVLACVGTVAGVLAFSLLFFSPSSYQNYWDHILPGLARGDVGDLYASPSLYAVFRYDVRDGWFDFLGLPRKALAEVGRQVHSVITAIVFGGLSLGWLVHRKRERTPSHDLLEYSQVILFVLLFSISVHGQWLIWSIPMSLYLISFSWTKRTAWLLLCGYLSLFLTHFYSTIPPFERLDWTLVKPSTVGLLLLFVLSIVCATHWFQQKQNTPVKEGVLVE